MRSYELYHSRTKGSKNGVRLFQFPDGTWTKEGLERRRALYQATKQGTDAYGQMANSRRSNEADEIRAARRAQAGREAAHMSDSELKTKVSRMNLEKQYKDLSSQDISVGKSYTDRLIERVGTVAAIGASAATIGLAIYQIRHGNASNVADAAKNIASSAKSSAFGNAAKSAASKYASKYGSQAADIAKKLVKNFKSVNR